ncbi:type II toxin-antitoxin system MqsA family antitoxin [Thermomonas sp. HDW16]|nr:type II toxin-antitoxin system MqsA family antitoxin [Thermomonas sp. HDW16]
MGDKTIQFEGAPLRVSNVRYSECSECGEKVVLPVQAKQNELAYADAKKARLGLWSCGKIEAFRKEWSITQSIASQLFGGGANAFSKYERGEVIHSKSMDLLMRVFSESEEAREVLTELARVRLDSAPSWKTIPSSCAPLKSKVSAAAISHSGVKIHSSAANSDRWETCEVAYG